MDKKYIDIINKIKLQKNDNLIIQKPIIIRMVNIICPICNKRNLSETTHKMCLFCYADKIDI
jgi:hypothetical protein